MDTFNLIKKEEVEHVEHISSDSVQPMPTNELPDRLAEEVSYGPGGVKGLVSSPFVFGAAGLASLGGFSFGYDQGVMSIVNVMDQFTKKYPQVSNSHPGHGFYTGFMTGMLELGAFLGCFFMPYLADKISRKYALTVVVCIFCIGAIIQTAAPNYGTLVAGRTIGGVGVGTLAMGAPLYISEVSPPQLRGTLLVLESVSIVTGVVSAFWITYGTRYIQSEAAFRLPFALQMICAIILGTAIHLFPFSPRWLALVGRNEDALDSLCRLRRLPRSDSRLQTEYRGILAEVDFQHIVLEKTHPGMKGLKLELYTWLDLFKKKVWRRTAIGVGVAFFQQFSGINAFIYYAPILFRSLGQSDEMSLVVSGALNIGQLVAVIICFFIIDYVGRRPLAIFGGASMTAPYVVMAVLVALYSSDWPAHPGAGWGAVAMTFVYMLTYGVSYSPLAWALPSEIFSNAQRAKGVALSTATVWLCNFIVGVAVPPMIESAGYGTYIFFAVMCLLTLIWAILLVPETRGKTLEEMDEVFGDTSAAEEKEMMKMAAARVLQQQRHTSDV